MKWARTQQWTDYWLGWHHHPLGNERNTLYSTPQIHHIGCNCILGKVKTQKLHWEFIITGLPQTACWDFCEIIVKSKLPPHICPPQSTHIHTYSYIQMCIHKHETSNSMALHFLTESSKPAMLWVRSATSSMCAWTTHTIHNVPVLATS